MRRAPPARHIGRLGCNTESKHGQALARDLHLGGIGLAAHRVCGRNLRRARAARRGGRPRHPRAAPRQRLQHRRRDARTRAARDRVGGADRFRTHAALPKQPEKQPGAGAQPAARAGAAKGRGALRPVQQRLRVGARDAADATAQHPCPAGERFRAQANGQPDDAGARGRRHAPDLPRRHGARSRPAAAGRPRHGAARDGGAVLRHGARNGAPARRTHGCQAASARCATCPRWTRW